MKRSRFALWLSARLMFSAAANPASALTGESNEAMRLIASGSVGMPEVTFQVSRTETAFTALRINSTINASTHQARNNEATAIVSAVAAEFTRKGAQYAEIQSISVDYVERTGTPAHDTVIDRIDFRKNTASKFELHIT